MRKRHHLLQQVPSKHLTLLQKRRERELAERKVFGTGEVKVCVCVRGESQRASSVHVTEVADWLVLHYAQVVHGAAVGDLDGLANAGRASLHHFDFVYGLVQSQRNHLGSRKPLPAALVVEEEDEVELLFGFVLHLFSDAEHVHGGHGDGHPVVLAAYARHVRVDDQGRVGRVSTTFGPN